MKLVSFYITIDLCVRSDGITRSLTQNYAFHWLMRDDGAIFAVALCAFLTPRRSVHNRRGAAHNCVSRNHGITGCRSWLMSLQGVPDRIISLDGAPRELFSPPSERVNRARRNLMSSRRLVVY